MHSDLQLHLKVALKNISLNFCDIKKKNPENILLFKKVTISIIFLTEDFQRRQI